MLRKARPSRKSRRGYLVSKPRACFFCQQASWPDWKNPDQLRQFISERGRILSAGRTGLCLKHQRRLTQAIKRSRHLGLLPFIVGVR